MLALKDAIILFYIINMLISNNNIVFQKKNVYSI